MEIQWLTIGYIPSDCSHSRIICGDAEESRTQEISLSICGDKISAIESSVEIEVDPAGFFDEKLKLWEKISKTFCSDFFQKAPDAKKLFKCYLLFVDEIEEVKGIYLLAEEGDTGEFSNENGRYNNTFYVRYQLEDDGDYFNERVLGFK
jgi:hypothetical protein